MLKKLKQNQIKQIHHQNLKQKITNSLYIPSIHHKSKQKLTHNNKPQSQLKPILLSKTTLSYHLKNHFYLTKTKSTQRILTKSTHFYHKQKQQQQNNFFLKNHLKTTKKKTRRDPQQLSIEAKQQKDAKYSNTTKYFTEKSSSNKISSRDKSLNTKSISTQLKINHSRNQCDNNNIIKKHHHLSSGELSPKNNKIQRSIHYYRSNKQIQTKKRQEHRLKKAQSKYLQSLQDKLQQKQAQYNTTKTRNILQQTKGIEGWVDRLTEDEMKRLRKIHRTQEEIIICQIQEIKKQILNLCENGIFDYWEDYYGGHEFC